MHAPFVISVAAVWEFQNRISTTFEDVRRLISSQGLLCRLLILDDLEEQHE